MKLTALALIFLLGGATSACGTNDQTEVKSIMWKCVTQIPELERLSRLAEGNALSEAAVERAHAIGENCEYAQVVLEHRKWRACEDAAKQYAVLAYSLSARTAAAGLTADDAGRSFGDAESDLRKCTHDLDQR